MPREHTVAIAQIRLARDMRRLLVLPALLWLVAAAGVAAALLLVGGPLRYAVLFATAVVVAVGLWLAVMPLTVRMQVEVGGIRIRWLGGERIHALTRGSVTRVTLHGPSAAQLRPRLGPLERGLGSATLREDERIELVRLAPTRTAILAPTDRGRLLIAPALEQELLNALAAAARVQARLEQVAERTRVLVARAPSGDPVAAVAAADRAAAEIAPRTFTGIERQLLEEHLASERASALAAAEAERTAAEAAARHSAELTAARADADAAASVAAAAPRSRFRLPALPRRRSGGTIDVAVATSADVTTLSGSAGPASRFLPVVVSRPADVHRAATSARRRRRRTRGTATAPPGTGALIVLTLLPTVAAVIGWALITFVGADRGLTGGRFISGLLLVGPIASLGVLLARSWWPRLAPLVAVTAVVSLGLVTWSLVGAG